MPANRKPPLSDGTWLPGIDTTKELPSLVASRNVDTVKRVISEKFGCNVNDEFARYLIKFVEDMTDGQ